ncbi:MAG: FAD-binding oxidoreductase [Pseudomonadota bacterium]
MHTTPKTLNTDSWGRLARKRRAARAFDSHALKNDTGPVLAFGNGRSYGDSCHCDDGTLLLANDQHAPIEFDRTTGRLCAGSGVLLKDVLELTAGTNWFPPVLPGTKFVTLGGAVANDIHGKNHAHQGTFGRHVLGFELTRSQEGQVWCSPTENAHLFRATIGGLGLTGFIGKVELQLLPVPSHQIKTQNRPFKTLGEFFGSVDEVEAEHEYCVAWIDSLASGKRFGRGILITGKHVETARQDEAPNNARQLSVPFTPPVPLVAGPALRAFNKLYFRTNAARTEAQVIGANSFFFPLDAVKHWNRLYGPKGLYQHQCVLPQDTAPAAVETMLRAAQNAGQGSFLTVLKKFGNLTSPGLLSFPAPGFTLTLDFPNRGEATRGLLNRLDDVVRQHGGRINPYKDARMSAETFQRGFQNWEELEELRDPAFLSNFWKRVTKPVKIIAPPLAPLLEKEPVNHAPQGRIHTHDVTSSASAKRPKSREVS